MRGLSGWVGPGGLGNAASAPAPSALTDKATSSLRVALMMMTGSGLVDMIRRVASKPSITGMFASIRTISGRKRMISRKASAPLWATHTDGESRCLLEDMAQMLDGYWGIVCNQDMDGR